jgi:hypothetical protein
MFFNLSALLNLQLKAPKLISIRLVVLLLTNSLKNGKQSETIRESSRIRKLGRSQHER